MKARANYQQRRLLHSMRKNQKLAALQEAQAALTERKAVKVEADRAGLLLMSLDTFLNLK